MCCRSSCRRSSRSRRRRRALGRGGREPGDPQHRGAASGLPWLQSIRSQSVTGLSSTAHTFQRGTDIMKARQMVQERLTLSYTLPNVSSPPVILQPLSATNRLMMVGVSSNSVDPKDLSLLARWTIKPRLLGVPGSRTWRSGGRSCPRCTSRSTPTGCAIPGSTGRRHHRRRRRAVGLAVTFLKGSAGRGRAGGSTTRTRGWASSTRCRSRRRRTWRRSPSHAAPADLRQDDVAGRGRRGDLLASAADRRRGRQTAAAA